MTLELFGTTHAPAGALELLAAAEPDRPEQLWYRDHDTGPTGYQNLRSYREAENVIRSRSDHSPWASIYRDVGNDHDPDWARFCFEVLGTGDRIYVCGCVEVPGSTWFWSSWPKPVTFDQLTPATVGPAWYRGEVWEEQLQTANDAVAQLRPALNATCFQADEASGYQWLNRWNDRSLLQHLRVPMS